jgi:TPR repeat protein
MSADQGFVSGQINYGVLCFEGLGVSINYGDAAQYFKTAANSGDNYRKLYYGICLLEGKGVELEVAQAVDSFRRSANQHNLTARTNLAFCLHQGIDVKLNRLKFVEYIKGAADQGDAVGQFNYVLCYYRGKGVLNDFTEAYDYVTLSANQGFIPSFRATASCLIDHYIDYGDLSSVAFYAGRRRGRDLSQSENGDENWKEYRRADQSLRLRLVDWGKLTKFRNLSVSRTLEFGDER